MKKFEIFGKNLSSEDLDGAYEYVDQMRKEIAEGPIDGEYEKNERDLQMISLVNKCINQKLVELGLENIEVGDKQIHLMTKEAFKNYFPNDNTYALNKPLEAAIFIDIDTVKDDYEMFNILLHESLHQSSFGRYHLNKENLGIHAARSGYQNTSQLDLDKTYFYGLNEAITHRLTKEIFSENIREIGTQFNFSPEELQEHEADIFEYDDYITILDQIIDRITQDKKISKEDIWKDFYRGYFEGDMMHFRKIENSFGKGSLRLLSAMPRNMNDIPHDELMMEIGRFFAGANDEAKDGIAKKILKVEEYEKYKS